MPPLYDNIIDALALTQDGTDHTVDIDNAGATMETNEAAFGEGIPSVWLKIDLSDPNYAVVYGDFVPVTFSSVVLSSSVGTLHPYIDTLTDNPGGGTFDPATPDFSLMHFPGPFLGNGTSTPPAVSSDFQLSQSESGIFYWFVGDWTGANEGIQRITYNIPAPPVITDADTSDYNTLSGTVTSLGGGVIKETQVVLSNSSLDQRGVIDAIYTFKVSGTQLPPNGRYQLSLLGKINRASGGASNFFYRWRVVVRRNGELLLPCSSLEWEQNQARPSTKSTWQMYGAGNVNNFSPKYRDGPGPDTVTVLAGDVFEVIAFNDNNGASDGSWIEISGLRFVQVEAGGHSKPIDLVSMPREALSSNADARVDPTNESSIYQKDFCVLDNGDIYVVYRANGERLRMVKYSGGAWSTVTSDLSINGYGTTAPSFGQLSVDTDGTNVYVVWGESDTGTSKTLTRPNGTTASFHPMRWHCQKYVPGTGFTELGTGQNAVPQSSRTLAASTSNYVPDSGDYSPSIKIKIAPDGVPWVGFGETVDAFYGTFVPHSALSTRVYIFYWDGSAWQDTAFPDHPNVDLTNDQGAYIDFIHVDAQHNIDFTFCQHGGPSNYPSVIYSLGSYDSARAKICQRFIYREYNGSSWGNLIDQLDEEIWPGETLTQQYHSSFHGGSGQQGMALGDNGIVPIFAAALWNSNEQNDFVKVAKVKTDGSAFESYYAGLHSDPDILFTGERVDTGPLGGWTGPTGCAMAFDSNGIPWVIYVTSAPIGSEYGLVLTRPGEVGTEDYWIIGSKENGMMYGDDSTGFSSIRIKNGNVYVLGFLFNGTDTKLNVYLAPINDTYNAWASGPGAASIIYYFKDGAWHQANSETIQDLHYFKDGAWHKKGSETTQTVQGRYAGSWVD